MEGMEISGTFITSCGLLFHIEAVFLGEGLA